MDPLTLAIVQRAVPLLRVADVARSIAWYRETLGFSGDPFPREPPHHFAILRQGRTEIMLRRGTPPARSCPGRRHGRIRGHRPRRHVLCLGAELADAGDLPVPEE